MCKHVSDPAQIIIEQLQTVIKDIQKYGLYEGVADDVYKIAINDLKER